MFTYVEDTRKYMREVAERVNGEIEEGMERGWTGEKGMVWEMYTPPYMGIDTPTSPVFSFHDTVGIKTLSLSFRSCCIVCYRRSPTVIC